MNAQSQHTRGPWRFDSRAEVSGIPSTESHMPFAIVSLAIEGACVIPVADICAFPPSTPAQVEIMKKNGQLIAAAPDLLTALEDCVQSLSRLSDAEGAFRVTCLSAAKAAIAKATQPQ